MLSYRIIDKVAHSTIDHNIVFIDEFLVQAPKIGDRRAVRASERKSRQRVEVDALWNGLINDGCDFGGVPLVLANPCEETPKRETTLGCCMSTSSDPKEKYFSKSFFTLGH